MVNNEILSFVKEQTAQGKTKDEIRDMLVVHGGWDAKDVEEAFDSLALSGKVMPTATGFLGQTPKTDRPLTPIQNFATPKEPQKTMQPTTADASISADTQFKKMTEPLGKTPLPVGSVTISVSDPASAGKKETTVISELRAKFSAPVSVTPPSKASDAPKVAAPTEPEKKPISIPPTTPIITPVLSGKATPVLNMPDMPTLKENTAAPQTPPENSYFASPLSSMKEVTPPPSAVKKEAAPGAPKETAGKGVSPNATVIKRESGQTPTSPVFSQAQKMNISPVGISRSPTQYMRQTSGGGGGRKILGFSMFLTGVVAGSVSMHAFLNGYFDPVINWLLEK